jgi:hypothetical protein
VGFAPSSSSCRCGNGAVSIPRIQLVGTRSRHRQSIRAHHLGAAEAMELIELDRQD